MSQEKRQHLPGCRYRLAVVGAVAVECPHGYDVCPICDPCTCPKEPARNVAPLADATGQP